MLTHWFWILENPANLSFLGGVWWLTRNEACFKTWTISISCCVSEWNGWLPFALELIFRFNDLEIVHGNEIAFDARSSHIVTGKRNSIVFSIVDRAVYFRQLFTNRDNKEFDTIMLLCATKRLFYFGLCHFRNRNRCRTISVIDRSLCCLTETEISIICHRIKLTLSNWTIMHHVSC